MLSRCNFSYLPACRIQDKRQNKLIFPAMFPRVDVTSIARRGWPERGAAFLRQRPSPPSHHIDCCIDEDRERACMVHRVQRTFLPISIHTSRYVFCVHDDVLHPRTCFHSPDVKADDSSSALAVALVHGLCRWRHVSLVLLDDGDGAVGDHCWKIAREVTKSCSLNTAAMLILLEQTATLSG